jgi:hypothetical protein
MCLMAFDAATDRDAVVFSELTNTDPPAAVLDGARLLPAAPVSYGVKPA